MSESSSVSKFLDYRFDSLDASMIICTWPRKCVTICTISNSKYTKYSRIHSYFKKPVSNPSSSELMRCVIDRFGSCPSSVRAWQNFWIAKRRWIVSQIWSLERVRGGDSNFWPPVEEESKIFPRLATKFLSERIFTPLFSNFFVSWFLQRNCLNR